eukprot:scaffold838_cov160-Ochromonas_danica.AAC.3
MFREAVQGSAAEGGRVRPWLGFAALLLQLAPSTLPTSHTPTGWNRSYTSFPSRTKPGARIQEGL